MTNKKVTVLAINIDTTQMDLYLENGETITIKQGDPRLKPILDQARNQILQTGKAEIVIPSKNTVYDEYAKKTGGLTKFFRIAKDKLKSLFSSDPEENTVEPEVIGSPSKLDKALANIEKHAKPSVDEPETEDETIVAVHDGVVIPNMEHLSKQMKWAIENNSITGVQNLITRLSKIIEHRQHSVEDLLRFINRGDLPIAADGSIIAYKVLTRVKSEKGTYVDRHTKQVKQRVGYRVQMAPEMVDPNRANECSNGLHIARRDYVGNFYGSVCVIARIRPEDVIAVPNYDANKMRVCGYDILYELSDEDFATLKRRTSLDPESDGMKAVTRILAGNTVMITTLVEIGGQLGTNLKYTKLDIDGNKIQKTEENVKATAIDVDAKSPDLIADPVDVKGLAKSVSEEKKQNSKVVPPAPPKSSKSQNQVTKKPVKSSSSKTKTPSKKEIVQAKFKEFLAAKPNQKHKLATEIVAMKKKQKVGWVRIGLTNEEGKQLTDYLK